MLIFSPFSTITNKPVKLKVKGRPKINVDLPFNDNIKLTTNKRNVEIYQNIWKFTTKTFIKLYREYNSLYNTVYETFLAVKPFYVQPASKKRCVCVKFIFT